MTAKSQLNLPPTGLPNREQGSGLLSKSEQGPDVPPVGEADAAAARLFDEVLTAAKLSSQEVAHLLGVSESLVRKMRSPNARERVALSHLLQLPLSFHLEFHRAMNRRSGLGRQLLRGVLDALGDLAVVLER